MTYIDFQESVSRTLAPNYNRDIPLQQAIDVLEEVLVQGGIVDTLKRNLFYHREVSADALGEKNSLPDLKQDDIYLLHGIIGIIGEAAELAAVAINLLEGHPVDRLNVVEESGDIQWYAELVNRSVGVDIIDVMIANMAKLKRRYPHKFNYTERKENSHDDEMKAIEETLSPKIMQQPFVPVGE